MSILVDTLLGTILEPIHLKSKVKEVSTPKFYFFDCGVVEALSGNLDEKLDERRGRLFETQILHELKAYSHNSGKNYEINFWGTPSENEVDFVCSHGKNVIGIEVKSSKKWRPELAKGLNVLLNAKKISKAFVVFEGEVSEKHDQINALTYFDFIKKLNLGEIL